MSLDVSLYFNDEEVFEYNITHNLITMAAHAGVYHHLWRPEELNISKAIQLIKPLNAAIKYLLAVPDYFKQFDDINKWGVYENLVDFIKAYLEACYAYPDAEVSISR